MDQSLASIGSHNNNHINNQTYGHTLGDTNAWLELTDEHIQDLQAYLGPSPENFFTDLHAAIENGNMAANYHAVHAAQQQQHHPLMRHPLAQHHGHHHAHHGHHHHHGGHPTNGNDTSEVDSVSSMSTASSPVLASPSGADDGSVDAEDPGTPPQAVPPSVVVYNPHTYAQLQAAAALHGVHAATPPSPPGFMQPRGHHGAQLQSLPISPLASVPPSSSSGTTKNGRPPLPPSSSAATLTPGPVLPLAAVHAVANATSSSSSSSSSRKRNAGHLSSSVKKEGKSKTQHHDKDDDAKKQSDIVKLFEFWDNRTHDKASRETCHWCGTACDSSKRRFCSNEYCGSTNNTGKSRAMFICDKCIKLQKGFFGANFTNVFGPGIDDPNVPWYCLNCLIIADYNETRPMGLCCCSFRRRDLFCGLHVIEGEDHIASQKNKLHCKAYRNPWEKKEAREDAKNRKGAAGKGKKARKTDRMAFFPLSVADMRVGRMHGQKRVVDTKFRTLHAPGTMEDRGLDDLAAIASSSEPVAESSSSSSSSAAAATSTEDGVEPRISKTLSLLPQRFRWLVERIRKYGWEAMLPSEQQPMDELNGDDEAASPKASDAPATPVVKTEQQ